MKLALVTVCDLHEDIFITPFYELSSRKSGIIWYGLHLFSERNPIQGDLSLSSVQQFCSTDPDPIRRNPGTRHLFPHHCAGPNKQVLRIFIDIIAFQNFLKWQPCHFPVMA